MGKEDWWRMLWNATIAALHHEENLNNPQSISYLKPFVDQYNWGKIKLPAKSKDQEKFEKKLEALNFMLNDSFFIKPNADNIEIKQLFISSENVQ